jgi:glutamate 5-kinase
MDRSWVGAFAALNSSQVRQALAVTDAKASPVVVHRDALVLQDR